MAEKPLIFLSYASPDRERVLPFYEALDSRGIDIWMETRRLIAGQNWDFGGEAVPFGTDLIFAARGNDGFVFGVEICEDYWAPIPPGTYAAMAGATILLNLSASPVTIGQLSGPALLNMWR